MPRRKNAKPRSNFSFVTVGSEAKEPSWLKIHSGAARSHAAYWGGSAKHRREANKPSASPDSPDKDQDYTSRHDTESAFGHSPDLAIRQQDSPVLSDSLYYIQHDNLQHLPPLTSELRATGFPPVAGLATFCGEGFVRHFFTLGHEDYSIMFSGSVLLNYAHSMALTGQGSKTVLLRLKGHVIHRISTRIKSSDNVLSPWCLTAIMALAAPVVCLVSQDLPKNLTAWEYLNASTMDDFMCYCPESANIAQRALEERKVHMKVMCKLIPRSHAKIQNVDSVALLRYISNSADISKAIEVTNSHSTPFARVGDLFPATDLCGNCSIPADWISPLTCQWLDEASETRDETQVLLLAGITHRWLATFLDRDGHELAPTKELLERRASLRRMIAHFVPAPKSSNSEADAMYESCRWASLVLLAVDELSIPVYVAAKLVWIRPRLTKRLRTTDLTNLWGVRRGLLFWVISICHFATAGQCFPLLCTALLARCAQEMAMLNCCSEISIKPIRRLKLFESLCCRPHKSS